jgi:hypothetical protein
MSAAQKARGDSVLKTLPDALQEELWQLCRRVPYAKARAWLKEKHGIETSETALSKFFTWYSRQGWLRQSSTFGDHLKGALEADPEFAGKAAAAAKAAGHAFEIMAAMDRDPKLYVALRRDEREREKLRQSGQRLDLLIKKAALVDELKNASAQPGGLTPEVLARIEQEAKLL